MDIDSGLFASPLGLFIILALVIGLGIAIYAFGAVIAGRMRQSRIQEETDGSGMQTGDPVNPVLDPEETIHPASREKRDNRDSSAPL